MSTRLLTRTLLAALVATGGATACATGAARGGRGGQFATLEVRNNYIGPIDLYAVSDGGFVQRIASTISGNGPRRFRLGPSFVGAGGTVRIIAVPFAENGRASTGRIVVRPGDVVQFNIAPDLAASSVFVR